MDISAPESDDRWLIAIDLDGTTIDEHDRASPAVLHALQQTAARGHHLVITTGRSPGTALRIVRNLGVRPEYIVCSNGAVILELADEATGEYTRCKATGFDASAVLQLIRQHLPNAHFAVENLDGDYRFTHPFPEATTAPMSSQVIVPFEELLLGKTARIVAITPGQDVIAFRTAVENMKLTGVTYSLGWTAWLDVAPEGITKAAAAEEVRQLLGYGRHRVLAVGDGYNDIELLQWAGATGRGVAMGHAPDGLKQVASEITGTLSEDGLAQVLLSL
jgi:Cof subfamily protein (haloacid dehalogenase superfamily)